MERICDKCNNFIISPAGTTETCWKTMKSPLQGGIDKLYAEERIGANKKNCKGFESLPPLK